ncbi:hypothetical protein J2774_003205 [Rhizobium pusense]|nr:hypothetical protein [Agrobacterium pusense]
MNREAFRIVGKIVTGIATDNDRQKLAHILQNKADELKPITRLKLYSKQEGGHD